MRFRVYVTNGDLSGNIHCVFWGVCTVRVAAESFLKVHVTGIVTNHKQKIPSQVCQVVGASTFCSYLQRLTFLQNKAIRAITGAHPSPHIISYYFKLKILKLQDLYNFKFAKLMHQYKTNSLPQPLAKLFISGSNIHNYRTLETQQKATITPHLSTLLEHNILLSIRERKFGIARVGNR